MQRDEHTDRVCICHLLFLISRGKPRSRGAPAAPRDFEQLLLMISIGRFTKRFREGDAIQNLSFVHHPNLDLESILLIDKNEREHSNGIYVLQALALTFPSCIRLLTTLEMKISTWIINVHRIW